MQPPSIPILNYHQIDTLPARGTPFRSLIVSPQSFARQMRFLRLLGYQGLSISSLLPYLQGTKGEWSGKVVGITFDDGYANNLQHALPALQANGFSSTCYIVSNKLGGSNDWDAGTGIASKPLMDAGQLRQWVDGGQEIGSHTLSHADLTALPVEEAEQEISRSRQDLQALLGRPVAHFCYPYGRFSANHVQQVAQAAYLSATTTERGRARLADGLHRLPRVPVLASTSLAQLWLKVATAYEDRRRA
jgi:peptidoglycan/xylan/chitin deacetylase (PgdA/CDA1 family)